MPTLLTFGARNVGRVLDAQNVEDRGQQLRDRCCVPTVAHELAHDFAYLQAQRPRAWTHEPTPALETWVP